MNVVEHQRIRNCVLSRAAYGVVMYRVLLIALIVLAALWAVADIDAKVVQRNGPLTAAVQSSAAMLFGANQQR